MDAARTDQAEDMIIVVVADRIIPYHQPVENDFIFFVRVFYVCSNIYGMQQHPTTKLRARKLSSLDFANEWIPGIEYFLEVFVLQLLSQIEDCHGDISFGNR